MTMKSLKVLFIGVLPAFLLGCQEGRIKMYSANTDAHFEKARKDIQEAATSVTEAMSSVRTDYYSQTQKKLVELDNQYQELLKQGQTTTGEAKAALLKRVQELEERRSGIKSRLEDYKKASDKAAESIRTGLDAALSDYASALANKQIE